MLYVISFAALIIMIQMMAYMRKHPHLRRMSFRNIWSQRQRSLYALIGGIMSTALIAAAMQLQFSMDHSTNDYMQQNFGPITAEISAKRQQVSDFTEEDLKRLKGDIQEDIYYQSFIPLIMGVVTASKVDDKGYPVIMQPKTMVYAFSDLTETEFPAEKSIEAYMKQATELSPLPGEVWLDSRTLEKLETAPGQYIVITVGGRETQLKVTNSVEAKGLLAYPGEEKATASVVMNEETAAQLFELSKGAVNRVLLLRNSDNAQISNYRGFGINDDWKIHFTAMLAYDDLQGATKLLPIFTISSLTSIFIGMLFIINLFQMMTEERRQEIGILRVIGMNAAQIRGLLMLEGFWYALISGLIGLIVGILLARLLVSKLGIVLTELMMNDRGLAIEFYPHIDPLSLAAAFGLGIILIMMCIQLVSGRPLKISIVEALKPVSAAQRQTLKKNKYYKWLIGGAAFITLIGTIVYSMTDHFLKSVSFPEIDLVGIIYVCFFILALAAVTTVLLLPIILKSLYAILTPLGRWRGMLKISLRYPLYYKRRTVLHLLMFSCVLFLTCFSAVFSETAGNHFGQVDPRNVTGGFERYALTSENITSELLEDKLAHSPSGNMEGLQYTVIQAKELPFGYKLHVYGITEDYGELQTIKLNQRAPGLASDQEVWRKVLSDPEWIIVSDNFLKVTGQHGRLSAGDMLLTEEDKLRYRPGEENGKRFEIRKRIAAIAEVHENAINYPVAQGIWMSSQAFNEEYADQTVSQFLLLKEGGDQRAQVDWKQLEKTLQAMNVYPLVDPEKISEQGTGFLSVLFRLFEGFNALAIFIGSTGLFLLMLRAFAERRQEFGMLRAIGVTSTQIRYGFTLEGAVIAVIGITIGVVIGTIGGYLMSQAFMQDGHEIFTRVAITLPWSKLMIYYFGAIFLTLLCTSLPARKAEKQSPAEAFHYTE